MNEAYQGTALVAMLTIGEVIKRLTPIDNRLIPVIQLAVGIPLQMLASGGDWSSTGAWFNALVWAGAASGLYEAGKAGKNAVKNQP